MLHEVQRLASSIPSGLTQLLLGLLRNIRTLLDQGEVHALFENLKFRISYVLL